MNRVAVVYFSQEGATHALAESVCEGIRHAEADVVVHRIVADDLVGGRFVATTVLDTIGSCDAVVFGSPTYMGGPAAQFKAFADASSDRWEAQQWRNKLAAGFTCGTSPNGDQVATLQYFGLLAAQHGMLWLGLDLAESEHEVINRLGTQLGASAMTQAGVETSDLVTARYLGQRVAQLSARWVTTPR